jgi:hypothetical protein
MILKTEDVLSAYGVEKKVADKGNIMVSSKTTSFFSVFNNVFFIYIIKMQCIIRKIIATVVLLLKVYLLFNHLYSLLQIPLNLR